MVTQTAYGLSKELDLPYDDALERVKAALQAEGFGVLTEIDVQDTLKQKLQVTSAGIRSSAPAIRRSRTRRSRQSCKSVCSCLAT